MEYLGEIVIRGKIPVKADSMQEANKMVCDVLAEISARIIDLDVLIRSVREAKARRLKKDAGVRLLESSEPLAEAPPAVSIEPDISFELKSNSDNQ